MLKLKLNFPKTDKYSRMTKLWSVIAFLGITSYLNPVRSDGVLYFVNRCVYTLTPKTRGIGFEANSGEARKELQDFAGRYFEVFVPLIKKFPIVMDGRDFYFEYTNRISKYADGPIEELSFEARYGHTYPAYALALELSPQNDLMTAFDRSVEVHVVNRSKIRVYFFRNGSIAEDFRIMVLSLESALEKIRSSRGNPSIEIFENTDFRSLAFEMDTSSMTIEFLSLLIQELKKPRQTDEIPFFDTP